MREIHSDRDLTLQVMHLQHVILTNFTYLMESNPLVDLWKKCQCHHFMLEDLRTMVNLSSFTEWRCCLFAMTLQNLIHLPILKPKDPPVSAQSQTQDMCYEDGHFVMAPFRNDSHRQLDHPLASM